VKTANLPAYNRDRESIGDLQITDEQVRNAIALYDSEYPDNDYPRTSESPHIKTWLENNNYDYALRYEGRCYPPKKILWLAIGPGSRGKYRFKGGKRTANRVLRELRFEVIPKYSDAQIRS